MKGLYTILLLTVSNIFMTFAWYSHLRLQSTDWFSKLSLPLVILFSWGIALAEYSFQVPANRIGYAGNGGPFNIWQLKVIQEFLSLTIFTIFTMFFFQRRDSYLKPLYRFPPACFGCIFPFQELNCH